MWIRENLYPQDNSPSTVLLKFFLWNQRKFVRSFFTHVKIKLPSVQIQITMRLKAPLQYVFTESAQIHTLFDQRELLWKCCPFSLTGGLLIIRTWLKILFLQVQCMKLLNHQSAGSIGEHIHTVTVLITSHRVNTISKTRFIGIGVR